MKTSFSAKVTGSITVSIEPSNEDGCGGGAADVDDDNGGNVLVDALLKSLVDDAVKKYAGDKGTTVEEEEDADDEDYDGSYPVPHRRIPSDADADRDTEILRGRVKAFLEADNEVFEAAELPTVQVDNEYEETKYQLSQKMDTMSLRRCN